MQGDRRKRATKGGGWLAHESFNPVGWQYLLGVSGSREEFLGNIIVRRAGEPLEMLSHTGLACSSEDLSFLSFCCPKSSINWYQSSRFEQMASLKFLLVQRMVTLDHQKWLCKLLDFDFDIEYKLGSTNRVTDFLSRIPSQATLLSLSVPRVLWLEDLPNEIAMDPKLSLIQQALSQSQPAAPGYSLIQGRFFYKNRLVLPSSSALIPLLLHECHDSPIGGHSGVLKTLKRAVASMYWQGMKKTIQAYVAACSVCQ